MGVFQNIQRENSTGWNTKIQPSLEIGEADDEYEKEANSVADKVMKMSDDEGGKVQKMESVPENIAMMEEEEEISIQKMQDSSTENIASPDIESQLKSGKGNGQSLSTDVQHEMGSKIGADFSDVKVHTDNNAVQMNKELGAKAFTHGNDIYFNSNQYSPSSDKGKHLLAHELTHTVQQKGNVKRKVQRKKEPGTYECKKGDTFASIAAKFNITMEELLKLNSSKYKLGDDGKTVVDLQNKTAVLSEKEIINVPGELPMNLGKGDAGKYKYIEFLGVPFLQGKNDGNLVDPNDVQQGSLGDCYFAAAMAAVARAKPEAIKNLIKDLGDGTYEVTLYLDKKNLRNISYKEKHIEIVDSKFPFKNDNKTPAYAKFGDLGQKNELWPMLLEKAYAQYLGSYGKIENGNPGSVMELLTGGKKKSFLTTELPVATQFKLIELALQPRFAAPVTCSAYPEPKNAVKETDKWKGKIRLSHAYAPISVDLKNMTITLQNPWGTPKYDVTINSTEFLAAFRSVQFLLSE